MKDQLIKMKMQIGGYEISSLGDAELKTLQERKTDRFRENRMSLGRLVSGAPGTCYLKIP